jgi:hypothetical protein
MLHGDDGTAQLVVDLQLLSAGQTAPQPLKVALFHKRHQLVDPPAGLAFIGTPVRLSYPGPAPAGTWQSTVTGLWPTASPSPGYRRAEPPLSSSSNARSERLSHIRSQVLGVAHVDPPLHGPVSSSTQTDPVASLLATSKPQPRTSAGASPKPSPTRAAQRVRTAFISQSRICESGGGSRLKNSSWTICSLTRSRWGGAGGG